MTDTILKKSFLISLLGHLAVFGIFSVSFGARMFPLDYGKVTFWGCMLTDFDLSRKAMDKAIRGRQEIRQLAGRLDVVTLSSRTRQDSLYSGCGYVKPFVSALPITEKQPFVPDLAYPARSKKKTTVMFYPKLPNYFSLYFKDRQVVHIELMFMSPGSTHSRPIYIRRKVSSGNLEADLLCMRYMSHYLFLQPKVFGSGGWQSVKIELSAKND